MCCRTNSKIGFQFPVFEIVSARISRFCKIRDLIPVSYTHLDVYKRQALLLGLVCLIFGVLCVCFHLNRGMMMLTTLFFSAAVAFGGYWLFQVNQVEPVRSLAGHSAHIQGEITRFSSNEANGTRTVSYTHLAVREMRELHRMLPAWISKQPIFPVWFLMRKRTRWIWLS